MDKLIPPGSAPHLVKAAWVLYPSDKQIDERKPFMEKAVAILEKRKDVLSPENQFTFGLAQWGINQREQALQYLQSSTRARPDKWPWRLDLARLLFELEKYADAREQAEIVLRAQPHNREATELLNKLDKIQRP
jgi:tetratricopeptide (TPR) repeat protein